MKKEAKPVEQQSLELAETKPNLQKHEPSVPDRFLGLMNKHYVVNVLPHLLKNHGISENQFLQIVSSEFKKNKRLQNAFIENPSSLFASILTGAEIGLIPSDLLGEFYLIPRKIDGKETITPLIGYKGLVKLLLRSGGITKIHAECVYEGDVFNVEYGLEPNIQHIPNLDALKNSQTLKYVYVVAKLTSGDFQFSVLSKAEIIKIKQMSLYSNDLYLNDKKDPQNWMVKKTVLIQLAKLLPKDYYGTKAVELDSHIEGGATLSLDENNQVRIVDGKKISVSRQPNVMNTFNNLPELEDGE